MGAIVVTKGVSRVRAGRSLGIAVTLLVLMLSSGSEGRPTETFAFESGAAETAWYRLRNQELQVDFSAARHHLPAAVVYRPQNLPLLGEGGLFLIDRINGQTVEIASATTEVHSEEEGAGAAIQRYRFPSPDGDWFRLDRSVRLLPDGAQLAIDYRITNAGALPRETQYSVALPWGGGLSPCRYHLPLRNEIRRLDADFSSESLSVTASELREPWVCVEAVETQVSVFLVAEKPIQGITLAAPQGGARTLEATLWQGTLGPSESVQGRFYIAVFQDVGLPITATPQLVAGASWAPTPPGRAFRLESRLFGMPREARRFRVFSQVYAQGRKVSLAPTYHQRSKLSPTSPLRVPLATVSSWPMIDLEQSVYSGSESVGYWKATLARPEWTGATGGLRLSALSIAPTPPHFPPIEVELVPSEGDLSAAWSPIPPIPLAAPPVPARPPVEEAVPQLHETDEPVEEPPLPAPVDEDPWGLEQEPVRNADPWGPDGSKPDATSASLSEIESPPLVVANP